MLKRKFDGKTIGVLLIMLMTVGLSAFAATRAADAWTLNPADFRYDMTLYFSTANPEYENPEAYEIGAFIGDECRGLAEKIELPDGGSCMYMRIRSNSTDSEAVAFMVRDKQSGQTINLKGPGAQPFDFTSTGVIGLPSEPYVLTAYYDVTVAAGENGSVDFTDGEYAQGSVIDLKALPAEGYHFEGWSDGNKEADRSITVTGPISLTAAFAVNYYTVQFKIGDDVIAEQSVAYGGAIKAPEAPAKEGYTFEGWANLPETMPASDLTLTGAYKINSYSVVFKIGDEIVSEQTLEFGAPIIAPEAPKKEGYTFEGWAAFPDTVPAGNVEVVGVYTVNSYKVTFKIGDEIMAEQTLDFGAAIKAPEAPAKEGYTFEGWANLPETMPASDLTITGSYKINSYSVVFKIGDEIVSEQTLEFGAPITAPEAPKKEGYTFEGWSDVPVAMPAEDIVIYGSYAVNYYHLILYINDEIYFEERIPYGEIIVLPELIVPENMKFEGWDAEIPDTMPAHDVVITGKMVEDESSSVAGIIFDADEPLNVYDLQGTLILKDVKAVEIQSALAPGLYIINGKKILVK